MCDFMQSAIFFEKKFPYPIVYNKISITFVKCELNDVELKILIMKRFVYYQPNTLDIKDSSGDCVIRALTKALGKSWVEVFDELVPYARELQCMPNGQPCFEKYVDDNGFIYEGVSNKKGTKRPTVESFAKSHPEGVYIARVAHHVVTIIDGQYFDTWDSGSKSMYGFWHK